MRVSVVLPAHNEADYLEVTVRDVVGGLRDRAAVVGEDFEVLVVENGSSDRTVAVADELAGRFPPLRVISLPDADYGRALRTGLLAAQGDVVVNFDVDYYDLGFLDLVLPMMTGPMTSGPGTTGDRHPAIVVGSKRAPGSHDARSWSRRLVTWGFSTLLRVAFRLEVSDTHGIKALDRTRVAGLVAGCRWNADLFDTELVIRAQRAGLGVAELPITAAERRPSRTSIARRVPRTIWGLVRLRMLLWREDGVAGGVSGGVAGGRSNASGG